MSPADHVSASLEPRTEPLDAWTDLLREFPTHRDTKIRALVEKHRPAIEEQAATEARRELLAKLREGVEALPDWTNEEWADDELGEAQHRNVYTVETAAVRRLIEESDRR